MSKRTFVELTKLSDYVLDTETKIEVTKEELKMLLYGYEPYFIFGTICGVFIGFTAAAIMATYGLIHN
jgi:hypothetical protein